MVKFLISGLFLFSIWSWKDIPINQIYGVEVITIVPTNVIQDRYIDKIGYISNSEIDILNHTLKLTTNNLKFDLSSKGNTPISEMIITKRAHCVGYARFYNSVFKKILSENKLTNYQVEHVRVHVKLFGIKVTDLINDKRFKDHDVCRITNTQTNNSYIVDPSLSEFFGNVIVITKQSD